MEIVSQYIGPYKNMNSLIIFFSAIIILLLALAISSLTYSGFIAKELTKQKYNIQRQKDSWFKNF